MSFVDADGVLEGGHSLVEFLNEGVLVAEKSVGVGKGGVHLDGPLEELDGRVVLFLQAEAVSCGAPGLRNVVVMVVWWWCSVVLMVV